MKHKDLIKYISCILLVCASYVFASYRFSNRKLSDVTISFTDSKSLFVADNDVNKLLIQNVDSVHLLSIEKLDLNASEQRLNNHDMIKKAEVSVSLNGKVYALIEQRKPIARLMLTPNVYLDSDKEVMPLSAVYTAHVPLVYGYKEAFKDQLFELINYINNDQFLKPTVTQIDLDHNGNATLHVRVYDYQVKLGDLQSLDHKFVNYKAFVAKMNKDDQLNAIKTIDLRFNNQVVSVKK